jgi:folate-binding protein YgfZ
VTDDVELDATFIDPEARDRVTVQGADAATYLQSQLSQDIRDLAVGESRWTLVLEPGGKIEVLARITRLADDRFVLDTDAGFGDRLAARLARFKIRVDAELSVEPAAVEAPSVAHETARVAAGWPRMGAEIEPGETIPAATGVESVAVSFTKGCYPGQELVERMNSRVAGAPRALRVVDAAPGAAVGDPVVDASGDAVGELTSVAPDGSVALAFVKRGADVGRPPAHIRT